MVACTGLPPRRRLVLPCALLVLRGAPGSTLRFTCSTCPTRGKGVTHSRGNAPKRAPSRTSEARSRSSRTSATPPPKHPGRRSPGGPPQGGPRGAPRGTNKTRWKPCDRGPRVPGSSPFTCSTSCFACSTPCSTSFYALFYPAFYLFYGGRLVLPCALPVLPALQGERG